jgi:acyl carrier protein
MDQQTSAKGPGQTAESLHMNESKKDRIRHIVATLLRLPPAELNEGAGLGRTPRWDSLAQLDILAACEEEFGLQIEPEDAVDLLTLEALVAYVEQHG